MGSRLPSAGSALTAGTCLQTAADQEAPLTLLLVWGRSTGEKCFLYPLVFICDKFVLIGGICRELVIDIFL